MTEQPALRPSFLTAVVWCILFTETAERFSYFGFRAILVLYFKNELEFDDSTSVALFAYVSSLAYFSPLLGALVADGSMGRYKTILWFGWLYAVGLSILTMGAFVSDSNMLLKRGSTFCGLFLVCIGTGGIKPCVSAFGADQVAHAKQNGSDDHLSEGSDTVDRVEQEAVNDISLGITDDSLTHGGGLLPVVDDSSPPTNPPNSDQVRAFFAYFYFCINVGAVTSIFLVPILKLHFGFGAAFLAPTVLLLLALTAFLSKRKEYVHHVPGEGSSSLVNTFRLCGLLLRQRLERNCPRFSLITAPWRPHQHVLVRNADDGEDETTTRTGDGVVLDNGSVSDGVTDPSQASPEASSQLVDAAQALHVLPILALLPTFWMLYDQQGSVWTLQAARMKLYGLQPEQLNIINPVEIMIFIPLFDRCIYPAMEQRGYNLSHLRRMSWGMALCAISFFVSGFLESQIQVREEQGDKVNIFWQLPQITILAVAEIFLSVTGYDFVYTNSPASMKAFLMAIYLLTTAVGDFFGGILYSSIFRSINRATAMHVCGLLMLCNLAVFCGVSRWWERCETENIRTYELVERTVDG